MTTDELQHYGELELFIHKHIDFKTYILSRMDDFFELMPPELEPGTLEYAAEAKKITDEQRSILRWRIKRLVPSVLSNEDCNWFLKQYDIVHRQESYD